MPWSSCRKTLISFEGYTGKSWHCIFLAGQKNWQWLTNKGNSGEKKKAFLYAQETGQPGLKSGCSCSQPNKTNWMCPKNHALLTQVETSERIKWKDQGINQGNGGEEQKRPLAILLNVCDFQTYVLIFLFYCLQTFAITDLATNTSAPAFAVSTPWKILLHYKIHHLLLQPCQMLAKIK